MQAVQLSGEGFPAELGRGFHTERSSAPSTARSAPRLERLAQVPQRCASPQPSSAATTPIRRASAMTYRAASPCATSPSQACLSPMRQPTSITQSPMTGRVKSASPSPARSVYSPAPPAPLTSRANVYARSGTPGPSFVAYAAGRNPWVKAPLDFATAPSQSAQRVARPSLGTHSPEPQRAGAAQRSWSPLPGAASVPVPRTCPLPANMAERVAVFPQQSPGPMFMARPDPARVLGSRVATTPQRTMVAVPAVSPGNWRFGQASHR